MPRSERARLLVTMRAGASSGAVLDAIDHAGAHVRSLEFEDEGDVRRVSAEVEIRGRAETTVIARLMDTEDVLGAEWTE